MQGWLGLCLGAALVATFFAAGGCDREPPDPPDPAAADDPAPTAAAPAATRPDDGAQPPPGPAPEGMTWVPGGTFWMGTDRGNYADGPVHRVYVDGFWIDTHEVTNAQFAAFVDATGYVTTAERPPDPALFPGVDPNTLVPGALVFTPPQAVNGLQDWSQWWAFVPDATWRHPGGPGSGIDGRMDHPVVQVSWDDAKAYADWAGRSLPTEAQWEFAARGGLDQKPYTWGIEPRHRTGEVANVWHGQFPVENTALDGYAGTAPVASFPPNGYGLHDMAGNVWEWTADWFRFDTYRNGDTRNPVGPPRERSEDPMEPGLPKKTIRGGSYLCSEVYCAGYKVSARMATTPDSAADHTGFRTVKAP